MRLALERLVGQARALPGERAEDAGLPRAAGRDTRAPAEALAPDELRRRTGALLLALGRRVDDELPRALALAARAWDQVDALSVVDDALASEAAGLRASAAALATSDDAATRAIAIEAQLVLDAAVGLVSLVERRLAALVRLRWRAATELLPDGRPFLDVGAALVEAARGWA
jgi:hypothetical protein